MKERDVLNYPLALVEALDAMLANDRLLNVFIYIAFNKSPVYDTPTVVSTLDLIKRWFLTIHHNNALVPASFDFTFFFKGIQILIDFDHGVSSAKVIWLLYRTLHIIPSEQRTILLKEILKENKFYDLFFHWSWNIRMLFHYLYFFQLHKSFAPKLEES